MPPRFVEPLSESASLGGRGLIATGRVEDEFGAVGEDLDVAGVDGDAVDDVGDRVRSARVDRDFGGFGVDLEAEADDDGAEVEGADPGGGDRDDREVGAVVGAGEVDVAGGLSQDQADSGFDQGVADLAWRGAARVGFLLGAAAFAFAGVGGGDRGLGAIGNACQAAGDAGRQLDREVGELRFAVLAGEVDVEGRVGSGAV